MILESNVWLQGCLGVCLFVFTSHNSQLLNNQKSWELKRWQVVNLELSKWKEYFPSQSMLSTSWNLHISQFANIDCFPTGECLKIVCKWECVGCGGRALLISLLVLSLLKGFREALQRMEFPLIQLLPCTADFQTVFHLDSYDWFYFCLAWLFCLKFWQCSASGLSACGVVSSILLLRKGSRVITSCLA